MTPAQVFGIWVRVIGLLLCVTAALYLVSGIVVAINPGCKANLSPAWQYFVVGLSALLIGLYFLRGAPSLLRFAYRDDNPTLR